MTGKEFDNHVMDILAHELGPGGYARYLMLHRSGTGDYTQEHQSLQADITPDQIKRALDATKSSI